MRKLWKGDLGWSAVTPKADWLSRRQLMGQGLAAGAALATGVAAGRARAGLDYVKSPLSTDETPNKLRDITSWNNFYEFGLDKEDPSTYAHEMTVDPWVVEVGGLVERAGRYDLADLLKGLPLEERIYRLRCVEAWSMVIPWIGVPLAGVLEKVGVQPSAKYVSFQTLLRPEEMRGQRAGWLDWPYREGLRLDEAMHPLTILATGLYGEELPNQNGAPLRLVVPWKYGFKGIKSIVRIDLVEREPLSTWQYTNPSEYGFYANVNPEVDHPRWSQASERRIGGGLFSERIPTQMFNGYAEQVAGLYAGMDLRQQY